MARAKRKSRNHFPTVLALTVALVLSAPFWGPELGRRTDWFDVARVEISGASLIPPHEVLRVSGIREGMSVLGSREPWERALRGHPVIEEARVSLRLPNTLRVRVIEKRAVALVGTNESLTPATAAGETLPVDPTARPLDLPIVPGSPDDPDSGPATRRALAELGRLIDLDPLLMREISEVRVPSDLANAVLLVHPIGEIIVPFGVDPGRLTHLTAVLRDAEPRLTEAGGQPPTNARIDLRFEGQVVVSHSSLEESS